MRIVFFLRAYGFGTPISPFFTQPLRSSRHLSVNLVEFIIILPGPFSTNPSLPKSETMSAHFDRVF